MGGATSVDVPGSWMVRYLLGLHLGTNQQTVLCCTAYPQKVTRRSSFKGGTDVTNISHGFYHGHCPQGETEIRQAPATRAVEALGGIQ